MRLTLWMHTPRDNESAPTLILAESGNHALVSEEVAQHAGIPYDAEVGETFSFIGEVMSVRALPAQLKHCAVRTVRVPSPT